MLFVFRLTNDSTKELVFIQIKKLAQGELHFGSHLLGPKPYFYVTRAEKQSWFYSVFLFESEPLKRTLLNKMLFFQFFRRRGYIRFTHLAPPYRFLRSCRGTARRSWSSAPGSCVPRSRPNRCSCSCRVPLSAGRCRRSDRGLTDTHRDLRRSWKEHNEL